VEGRRKPFFSRSIDLAVLLAAVAAAVLAALSLRNLRFDPDLGASVRANAEKAEFEAANRYFPDEHLVFVSLPCADPFASASLRRLRDLSSSLEEGERAGKWRLYGPTTVKDFVLGGDRLVSETLYDPTADASSSGERLRARLQASPLLSRLFLSTDRKAWTLILSPKLSDEGLLSAISDAKRSFPEIKVGGLPYHSAIGHRILVGEFGPLIAGSAAILLVVEFALVRSFGMALLLWACSSLPALLLMGLFAVTGTPMRLHYALAPALTLALSNSYVTHMHLGWTECGFDPRAALRSKAKASLLDAATTALGFGSLFLSPIAELVTLGAFSIAGAAFSVLSGLVVLPAALGLVDRPAKASLRFSAGKPAKMVEPRSPGARIAVWAAACIALVFFSLRLENGYEIGKVYLPWTDKAREASYIEKTYEGLNEISLVLPTGKENGLVDPAFFRSMKALQRDIASMPGVVSVYGPGDLVEEILARWEGASVGSVEPESESDIGESLQLLSGSAGGLFSRGFVDASWSTAKMRIAVASGFKAATDFLDLKVRVDGAIARRLPGIGPLWSGDIVGNSIEQRCFIKGQISGGLGFFAALFVGLCLFFRSITRAFLVTLVPVTGFLASLGLMGILGWSITAMHAVALATIAGTGVDSAIVLVLGGWSKEARAGTVSSTLLVSVSMASLLFCTSYFVVQTTIICIAGLAASALAAIFVLPALSVIRRKPDHAAPFRI
jgi:uncharacterized protein